LNAKKEEDKAELEFDNADTEEQLDEALAKTEEIANELEGKEVVEADKAAKKSRLDLSTKLQE
jgi:cell fate (sporulation/competence/biofilm development) regulator YlbF (YheA/YmcA/DUF963 family)